MKNTKKIIKPIALFLAWFILLITVSDILTILISHKNSYNLEKYIPKNEVWMVLGTSKYLADWRRNLFYIYRMNAVMDLYNAWKIKKVLVSWDNWTVNYDETSTMRNDLAEKGIPLDDIYMDYAGFRTLDSVVRGKEVFGQSEFTIISQEFHVQRAVVLAKFYWIDAIWYEAQKVPVKISPRVWLRERGARVKMWLDIIVRKQPKFLWDPVDMSKPQEEISDIS